MQRTFVLAPAAWTRLVELATTAAHTAYDYQRFTGMNDHFTQAQKIDLVEAMWQVAYADDHLTRTSTTPSAGGGLLHVTHGEYIAGQDAGQRGSAGALMPLLHILWRDDHLVAVYKPAGWLVHTAPAGRRGNPFCDADAARPAGQPVYPVHRLDKGT